MDCLPNFSKRLNRLVSPGHPHTRFTRAIPYRWPQVFSWGNGTFGALGLGTWDSAASPQRIDRLWSSGIVQVACGENHSAALSVDGRVYTWGLGKYG